ncbi:hypothetical protein ACIQ57_09570 [Lysinibacillus xylanilyticus]
MLEVSNVDFLSTIVQTVQEEFGVTPVKETALKETKQPSGVDILSVPDG